MNTEDIKFYQVGGCVRDEMLGHEPNDIDYSVEATSFQHMRKHLSENKFKIYVEKEQYGTIKAKCPVSGVVADYTLCRKDGHYSDHRRPDNIQLSDITNDLSRRDFTMNAIAKIEHTDGTTEYYDPFNGIQDIERRLIKCVGNPAERLTEDPLRGLRALRFSITKDFQIDSSILNVLKTRDFKNNFRTLPKERIQVELMKMFKHNTLHSMHLLCSLDMELQELIFPCGMWLIPTVKQK